MCQRNLSHGGLRLEIAPGYRADRGLSDDKLTWRRMLEARLRRE